MSSDVNKLADQLAKTTVEPTYELSFADQGLKLNSRDDAKGIVEAIEKADVIRALRFQGNTMGIEAAEAIGKALEKHPEFQRALWSDMFTGRLKTEIPQALQHLGSSIMLSGANLVELDLSDNAFGPTGLEGIKEFLKSESCYSLKELKLNNNGLGIQGGKMLAESLLECHRSSSEAGQPLALKTFISGRNRLENPGATALARAFKAMGSLEHIAMPQNGIRHEGVTALADAAAACKQLRILNLNDNTFRTTGSSAIAEALPALQELEVINFGDCLLHTEGALHIAAAIKDGHNKLKELILSGNEISAKGGIAIAKALVGKECLEKVELGANNFCEDGVSAIQDIFQKSNLGGVIDSMSDDEGTDEESDGEENEEEETDESEEEGETLENEDSKEKENSDDVTRLTQEEASSGKADLNVSVKTVLSAPTKEGVLGLGPDIDKKVKEELQEDADNVSKVVHILVKMSTVVTLGDERTKGAVAKCADALLSDLYERSTDENQLSSNLTNSLLVNLGLLKSEDKIHYNYDLTGPLQVLEHVVRQSYFPKSARDVFQVFLSRPNPQLEKCWKAKHSLMQALFQ